MAAGLLTSTPVDYKDTLLYQTLLERDAKRKKAKKKSNGLLDKVTYFIDNVSPLLDTVGKGAFHDYTLHTPEHSRKLLHIAGYIIPKKTLAALSDLELAVMIMSFYLHDVGMVVDEDRKNKLLADSEFLVFLETESDFKERIQGIRDELKSSTDEKKPRLENQLAQLYEAAFTKFLRPLHSKKPTYEPVVSQLEAARGDLFTCSDRSFRDQLVAICASHNENTSILELKDETGNYELDKNYVCSDQRLNMQYCAAVLRLADILDFDAERTPAILFRSLGIEDKKLPGFKISLQEWNKQMAVKSIDFKDNEIEVQADSNSPAIGESIKRMCQDIEREIRDTTSFLNNAPKEIADKYKLQVPLIVKPNIKRKGYADINYSIHLDEKSIMTLLMGENLYERSQVALRELIQNSIDACILRTKIDVTAPVPEIKVVLSKDTSDRVWLKVQDNGIGMDDKVLSNYFFNIGKSYYRSSDFLAYKKKQSITEFSPISRFGIGILSIFMIADALMVTTQNGYSESDKKHKIIFIDDSDSMAFVKESSKTEQGTSIEIRLKKGQDTEEQLGKLYEYIKEVFLHPAVSIQLYNLEGKETSLSAEFYTTITQGKKELFKENGVEVVEVDFGKYSSTIKGRGTLILFKNDDGTFSWHDKSSKLQWGSGVLKLSGLTNTGFTGKRITVNGAVMSMKKLSTLLHANRKRFHSILDVNVINNEQVSYNVSRTRIVGTSRPFIRAAIKEAFSSGLKDNGIYEKMDEETQSVFNAIFNKREGHAPLTKEMFQKIEPMVPEGEIASIKDLVLSIGDALGEDKGNIYPYVYAILNRRNKESKEKKSI